MSCIEYPSIGMTSTRQRINGRHRKTLQPEEGGNRQINKMDMKIGSGHALWIKRRKTNPHLAAETSNYEFSPIKHRLILWSSPEKGFSNPRPFLFSLRTSPESGLRDPAHNYKNVRKLVEKKEGQFLSNTLHFFLL